MDRSRGIDRQRNAVGRTREQQLRPVGAQLAHELAADPTSLEWRLEREIARLRGPVDPRLNHLHPDGELIIIP